MLSKAELPLILKEKMMLQISPSAKKKKPRKTLVFVVFLVFSHFFSLIHSHHACFNNGFNRLLPCIYVYFVWSKSCQTLSSSLMQRRIASHQLFNLRPRICDSALKPLCFAYDLSEGITSSAAVLIV